MPTGARANSFVRSQQNFRVRQAMGSSRANSTHSNSNPNSRAGSAANSRANSPVRRDMRERHDAEAIRESLDGEENEKDMA